MTWKFSVIKFDLFWLKLGVWFSQIQDIGTGAVRIEIPIGWDSSQSAVSSLIPRSDWSVQITVFLRSRSRKITVWASPLSTIIFFVFFCDETKIFKSRFCRVQRSPKSAKIFIKFAKNIPKWFLPMLNFSKIFSNVTFGGILKIVSWVQI